MFTCSMQMIRATARLLCLRPSLLLIEAVMKKLLLLLSLVVPLVALAGPGEGISGSPSRLQAPEGVGVNPSPWLGSSVDVGSYAGMASDTLNSYFLSNAYKRAEGNFVYKAAGRIAGFTISLVGGVFSFGVASSSLV